MKYTASFWVHRSDSSTEVGPFDNPLEAGRWFDEFSEWAEAGDIGPLSEFMVTPLFSPEEVWPRG